jgi:uncharacterized protein (DUF3084 family)
MPIGDPQPPEPRQDALQENEERMMATADPLAMQERAKLENDKLKAEIHNLRRRWPLFAPYVTGTLTVVAIATGTWITYRNSEWKRDAETARTQVQAAKTELFTLQGQLSALRMQMDQVRQQADMARSERDRSRTQAAQLHRESDAARSARDLLEKRARDFQGQILRESSRVQNVANMVLAGNVFNDNRLLQYSQINQIRTELKKIADEMLTSVPQK